MLAFPEDYRALVPKLLTTMTAIGQSLVSRINLAAGDVVPETKALSKGNTYTSFSHVIKDQILISCLLYFTASLMSFGFSQAPTAPTEKWKKKRIRKVTEATS